MSAVEVLAGVDIVALRLSEAGALQVLLIRRQREPYAGQWALPGVLVNGRCVDASLDAAAERALKTELANRGVDDPSRLPNYLYRDDALQLHHNSAALEAEALFDAMYPAAAFLPKSQSAEDAEAGDAGAGFASAALLLSSGTVMRAAATCPM